MLGVVVYPGALVHNLRLYAFAADSLHLEKSFCYTDPAFSAAEYYIIPAPGGPLLADNSVSQGTL